MNRRDFLKHLGVATAAFAGTLLGAKLITDSRNPGLRFPENLKTALDRFDVNNGQLIDEVEVWGLEKPIKNRQEYIDLTTALSFRYITLDTSLNNNQKEMLLALLNIVYVAFNTGNANPIRSYYELLAQYFNASGLTLGTLITKNQYVQQNEAFGSLPESIDSITKVLNGTAFTFVENDILADQPRNHTLQPLRHCKTGPIIILSDTLDNGLFQVNQGFPTYDRISNTLSEEGIPQITIKDQTFPYPPFVADMRISMSNPDHLGEFDLSYLSYVHEVKLANGGVVRIDFGQAHELSHVLLNLPDYYHYIEYLSLEHELLRFRSSRGQELYVDGFSFFRKSIMHSVPNPRSDTYPNGKLFSKLDLILGLAYSLGLRVNSTTVVNDTNSGIIRSSGIPQLNQPLSTIHQYPEVPKEQNSININVADGLKISQYMRFPVNFAGLEKDVFELDHTYTIDDRLLKIIRAQLEIHSPTISIEDLEPFTVRLSRSKDGDYYMSIETRASQVCEVKSQIYLNEKYAYFRVDISGQYVEIPIPGFFLDLLRFLKTDDNLKLALYVDLIDSMFTTDQISIYQLEADLISEEDLKSELALQRTDLQKVSGTAKSRAVIIASIQINIDPTLVLNQPELTENMYLVYRLNSSQSYY